MILFVLHCTYPPECRIGEFLDIVHGLAGEQFVVPQLYSRRSFHCNPHPIIAHLQSEDLVKRIPRHRELVYGIQCSAMTGLRHKLLYWLFALTLLHAGKITNVITRMLEMFTTLQMTLQKPTSAFISS